MALFDFLNRRVANSEYTVELEQALSKMAFRELAMNIATSYITNAIAKCELKTYEGGKQQRSDLYYKLNISPNPNESGAQFMAHLVHNLLYQGEALVVPLRNSIYVADSFAAEKQPTLNVVYKSITVEDQLLKKAVWKNKDVYYFRLNDDNVAAHIAQLYADYRDLIDAAMKGYAAGAKERWILDLANTQAGDARFAEDFNTVIKAQLKTFMENDRSVYPQFKGQQLQRVTDAATASVDDITKLRAEIFESVAQAYHVPQAMMTGNINSVKDVFNIFLTVAVDPIAEMIGDEFTRKSFDFDEWNAGAFVKVDTSKVCHVDMFEAAASADKLISSGAFVIDEVREGMGADANGDEFSTQHFITKNYTPAELALAGGTVDNNL